MTRLRKKQSHAHYTLAPKALHRPQGISPSRMSTATPRSTRYAPSPVTGEVQHVTCGYSSDYQLLTVEVNPQLVQTSFCVLALHHWTHTSHRTVCAVITPPAHYPCANPAHSTTYNIVTQSCPSEFRHTTNSARAQLRSHTHLSTAPGEAQPFTSVCRIRKPSA
jgi:hypothetical protein